MRSDLAALLWDGPTDAARRNSLNATLTRMRQALPVWPLQTDRDTIVWTGTDVVVDATRFRQLTRTRQEQETAGERAELAQAVALWRGPLLAGFPVSVSAAFEEWVEEERRAWDGRMAHALVRLIQLDEAAQEWAALAAHARQAIQLDPLQERFHRSLMTAYVKTGDRVAALAQYEACRRILASELDVAPAAETTALRDAIVAGDVATAVSQVAASLSRPAPGPTSASVPIPALLGNAAPYAPLVGRAQELERLTAALARTTPGYNPLVVLYGAAGIGKSRLLQELLWQQPREGITGTWLLGACYEESQRSPYAPVVQALARVAAQVDLAGLHLPDDDLAVLARLLPEVARQAAHVPQPPALDPGGEQRRLFHSVARLLAALPEPVVLILEDLHWADEATLLLLSYLLRPATAPGTTAPGITVLGTVRAGDLSTPADRFLQELQSKGQVTWLELSALPLPAVETLVVRLTGSGDGDLGRRLYAEAQGNPLFTIELLRARQETGGMELAGGAAQPAPGIPQTVRSVILGRLGRLPAHVQAFAVNAALFPDCVPFAVLQQMAGLDEETALRALEALLPAGFLHEQPEGIGFAHQLIRRAVTDSVAGPERRALHRRAYECLLKAKVIIPEQLAFHAVAGERWEEGLRWSREAAENARRHCAYQAAIRYLEQALDCLSRLPAAPELRQEAVHVRLRLCQISFFSGAERLAGWAGPALAEATALGDEASLAQLQLIQANVLLHQGRYVAAGAILQQVLAYARRSGDTATLARCLRTLSNLLTLLGDFPRALALGEEALPLQEALGAYMDTAVAYNSIAALYAFQGDFDRAEVTLRRTLARSRKVGDGASVAHGLAYLHLVAYLRGQWPEAVRCSTEGVQAAREAGQPGEEFVAGLLVGPAMARTGDPLGGVRAQEAVLALAGRLGTQFLTGLAHAGLSEALLEAGELGRAEAVARSGLEITAQQGARMEAAGLLRILGQVLGAQGRRAEACTALEQALAQHVSMGTRPEAGRCHAALAGLTAGPERESHRRAAAAILSELGMAWDLQRLLA